MATATTPARIETIAELLQQLGGISPRRVRLRPWPGTATEKDLIRLNDRSGRLYELVEGVLVEKAVGFQESMLTCDLIEFLRGFVRERKLGIMTGPDGGMRLMPRVVRLPDIAFISWERLPNRQIPDDPVPDLVPDLAIEILSKGNTRKEMRRKRREYFRVGVRLVWEIDLKKRTVVVFTTPDESVVLTEKDTLDGGDVLPGLKLPVRQVFAEFPSEADDAGNAKKPPRKIGKKS
jgi:Uma2 family endonuclease